MNRLSAHTAWMHWLFIAVAKYGIVLFALALVMAWWIARGSGPEAVAAVVWAGASALGALGLAQVIGGAVDRARPYTAMPTAHVLISRTTDFSFPSDHASVSGAVAAGLLVAARRCDLRQLAGAALAIAVLMAFSRVYVGVHYPGDVLAGLALGAGVAVAGAPLVGHLLDPLARRLADTPLRPLVMGQVVAPA